MQVISPIASHSGMQEEYRSEVQDSPQQTPDSGIEQYGTKPQEDHNNQQGTAAADKWWEQGRRPRGDWGDGPPKKFEVGRTPHALFPPNILRSRPSVVGCA